MRTPSLVVGLTAVFAGLTTLLVVLAFAFELGLLVIAVPFGAATYGFWYHASGRLAERTRRRPGARTRAGGEQGGSETGGFGAGPRESWTGPRSDERGGRGRRRGASGQAFRGDGRGARGGRQASRRVGVAESGPTIAEAYDVLGLDSDADASAIERAYRTRVKEVHPDTDGGSARAFKRVNEAYERLSE